MFKNTLLLVFRSMRRDIGFTTINLVGLAIGLAACMLILLYVTNELSYDTHYDRSNDIHRLVIDADIGGSVSHYAVAPYAALPAFRDDIAAIQFGTRVQEFDGQVVVDDVNFEEEEIILADTAFFEVFSAVFISGDPESALDAPGSVVITEKTAQRLFDTVDAVGESLKINNLEMTISGVVKNPTAPSHLSFDFVVSIMNLPEANRAQRDQLWYAIGMQTYVVLAPNTNLMTLENDLAAVLEERAGATGRAVGISFIFHVQPLKDIHLHSHLQSEFRANGNILFVYAFSIIAVFILLIACINFANLSVARSRMRAREVGVRKAVGAGQGALVTRFLTESFVMVTMSSILALFFAFAALGWLNSVTGKSLTVASLATGPMIFGSITLLIICVFMAGSYPAIVLSSFQPIDVLRGQVSGVGSRSFTRRSLVVLQFTVSIVLIIGALVMKEQIEYMKTTPLGFDKDVVVVVQMDTENDRNSWDGFRQTLLSFSGIEQASFASGVPGRTGELRLFIPEGADSSDTVAMTVLRVDQDYVDTYGMNMAEGRFFSRDFPADTSEAFVINEAAARILDWADGAVGKKLEWSQVQQSTVIGVVQDYHYRPLTEEIAPLVFWLNRRPSGLLTVRFQSGAEKAAIEYIKKSWAEYEMVRPLNLTFVDEDLASRYGQQETTGDLITTFTFLALFIAALGLFGLASLTVQQKTKEIGIRKALGASVGQLIFLVSREFTILLVLANVIAWPVGYVLISKTWLDQFPYRLDLSVAPFLAAAFISFAITVVATIYHSSSAARADPVESLRYE